MSFIDSDWLDAMSEFVEGQLGDLLELWGPTWDPVRKINRMPVSRREANIPGDVAMSNKISETLLMDIAGRYNIRVEDYRLITVPLWVLQRYPNIDNNFQFRKPGETYTVLEPEGSDETQPIMLQIHCRRVHKTQAG